MKKEANIAKLIQQLQQYAIALMLFYTPLIVIPSFNSVYNLPKILLIQLIGFLVVGLEAVKLVINKKQAIAVTRFDVMLLGYFAAQILSWFFSIHRPTSFFGVYNREGLNLLSASAYIGLAVVAQRIFSAKNVSLLYNFFISATTLAALYTLYERYTLGSRPNGLEGQPIVSSATIALGLVLLITLFAQSFSLKKRALPITLIVIHSAALYVLEARSVWTAVFLSLAVAVIMLMRTQYKTIRLIRSRHLIAALIVTIVVGSVLSYAVISKETISARFRMLEFSSVAQLIKGEMLYSKNALKNFLVGTGQGSTFLLFPRYRDTGFNQGEEWNWRITNIRNHYLEILITTGIFGLTAWFLVWRSIVQASLRHKKYLILIFYVVIWQLLYYLTPTIYATSIVLLSTLPYQTLTTLAARWRKGVITTMFAIAIGGLLFTVRLAVAEYYAAQNRFDRAFRYAPHNSTYLKKQISPATGTPKELLERHIALAQHATIIDPLNSDAWLIYSFSLYRRAIIESNKQSSYHYKALLIAERYRALNPTDPTAYDNLGLVYLDMKDYARALAFFRTAQTLKPDLPGVAGHIDLTLFYMKGGKSE